MNMNMKFGEAGQDRLERSYPMVINYNGGGFIDFDWLRTLSLSINRIQYSESAFIHGCESKMFGIYHYEYFWILAR